MKAMEEETLSRLMELGQHLVWRIGKDEREEVLVVRVGFASKVAKFAQMPRLLALTDREIETLSKAGKIRVEWVD